MNQLTVGRKQINYPGNVRNKTVHLTTAKILLNHIISTHGAQIIIIDIKDFYLNTPIEHYEYMAIPLANIPETIIWQYNLQEKAYNGNVYVKIHKGMYVYLKLAILWMINFSPSWKQATNKPNTPQDYLCMNDNQSHSHWW